MKTVLMIGFLISMSSGAFAQMICAKMHVSQKPASEITSQVMDITQVYFKGFQRTPTFEQVFKIAELAELTGKSPVEITKALASAQPGRGLLHRSVTHGEVAFAVEISALSGKSQEDVYRMMNGGADEAVRATQLRSSTSAEVSMITKTSLISGVSAKEVARSIGFEGVDIGFRTLRRPVTQEEVFFAAELSALSGKSLKDVYEVLAHQAPEALLKQTRLLPVKEEIVLVTRLAVLSGKSPSEIAKILHVDAREVGRQIKYSHIPAEDAVFATEVSVLSGKQLKDVFEMLYREAPLAFDGQFQHRPNMSDAYSITRATMLAGTPGAISFAATQKPKAESKLSGWKKFLSYLFGSEPQIPRSGQRLPSYP